MTPVKTIVSEAAAHLRDLVDHPWREARLLVAHILRQSYEDIFFADDHFLTDREKALFDVLLQRRLNHEPLSKIIGYREFWGLRFQVTKDTLDPRPDSETLIEAVLTACPARSQPLHILDLGTGTGCLLLSLLHEYPNARGVGIDISEAAIGIAQQNATRFNLKDRCSFAISHWGDALSGTFDVIISNPPYIANSEPLPLEVRNHDPEMALFAGKDGLNSYRALANQLPRLASPHSKIFLEMGAGQSRAIQAIFSFASCPQTILDLSGTQRCFAFSLPHCPT